MNQHIVINNQIPTPPTSLETKSPARCVDEELGWATSRLPDRPNATVNPEASVVLSSDETTVWFRSVTTSVVLSGPGDGANVSFVSMASPVASGDGAGVSLVSPATSVPSGDGAGVSFVSATSSSRDSSTGGSSSGRASSSLHLTRDLEVNFDFPLLDFPVDDIVVPGEARRCIRFVGPPLDFDFEIFGPFPSFRKIEGRATSNDELDDDLLVLVLFDDFDLGHLPPLDLEHEATDGVGPAVNPVG